MIDHWPPTCECMSRSVSSSSTEWVQSKKAWMIIQLNEEKHKSIRNTNNWTNSSACKRKENKMQGCNKKHTQSPFSFVDEAGIGNIQVPIATLLCIPSTPRTLVHFLSD
jgi:hypothetical protein